MLCKYLFNDERNSLYMFSTDGVFFLQIFLIKIYGCRAYGYGKSIIYWAYAKEKQVKGNF
jgi:hypothetical protein